MELFNLKQDKVVKVDLKPFKLEAEIQSIVEKNIGTIFQMEFIQTEFSLGNYRIDTLCYDNENNSLVIIEYKRGNSYSVIDQGYSYLQLLLNNKSDFILRLSQHFNKVLKVDDIDWSQSKIIFISQSFNTYQKDSVNFKNLPFELWEIKRFANDSVILDRHISTSKESIESLSNTENQNAISAVSKEVKTVDENFHLDKTDDVIRQKYKEIKEQVLELEGVEVVPKNNYISLMYGSKTIAYFNFRKNAISLDVLRGNINPDGSKSKNYFNIDDPKNISEEGSWEWKTGTQGNYYKIRVVKDSDVEYLMFLLKQKYNNIIQ